MLHIHGAKAINVDKPIVSCKIVHNRMLKLYLFIIRRFTENTWRVLEIY